MPKFFHVENANRIVGGVVFEPYDVHGGVLWGVYRADVESEIVALSALATSPTSGVEELTEAQYVDRLKKKRRDLVIHPRSVNATAPKPLPPLKGTTAAVVVDSPGSKDSSTHEVSATKKFDSVDDAVLIGSVVAPQPKIEPVTPKGKK